VWQIWGDRSYAYRVLVGGKLREIDYFEDLGVDAGIFKK